jgi:hypothetical protein
LLREGTSDFYCGTRLDSESGKKPKLAPAIHEATTSRSQGRNPSTSTAVQENRGSAVLGFEIMQHDRYTDYLKIATQRH